MTATKPIVLSEHALAYADSRRVDPHELLAAIRTEPWHRRGGGRFECRKNFARTGSWADTKQVRVLIVNEPSRIVVVTAYGSFVRLKITYDGEVDVLYIRFKDTRVASRHVSDDIALDYDAEERLAGSEILDASAVIADPAALDGATFERL